MRLAWATDIHLNFLRGAEIDAFATRLVADGPDALVVTGDISEAPALSDHVEYLASRVKVPLYFVLGNHDFYRGSIAEVRAVARRLTDGASEVWWLPARGVVRLTERACLIGCDGWGDARLGNWEGTPVRLNDFRLIEDLAGLPHEDLVSRVRRFGKEEAAQLRLLLDEACGKYRDVVVATHVPPFRESCWHEGKISDDDWLPWFTCGAVGDVLRGAAEAHPEHVFRVICGHTHGGGEAEIADNLTVLTGAAEYGDPVVQVALEVS